MSRLPELPDLKVKLAEMSQCNTIDQWIKLSDELIEIIRKYLYLIQTDGLFTFSNLRKMEDSYNTDEFIVVDELFFPFSNYDINLGCYLWNEKMIQFISSFKDSQFDNKFIIYSNEKEIKFLIASNDNLEKVSQHLESFFPGICYKVLKKNEKLKNKLWIGEFLQ